MDKKPKLDQQGDHKSVEKEKAKEAALDKLRQMEWIRNRQDNWHLARASSGTENVYERKKFNKDEDNYFEGTNSQKNKKTRRPRLSEGSSTHTCVPPGFSLSSGPCGPPPINAWSKKKGSALFSKPQEEEDEVLKLVLQESLKTAEEDQARQLERLRMMNIEEQSCTKSEVPAESEWEKDLKEDYSSTHVIAKQPPKPDLQFIDTDSAEEIYYHKRFLPPRMRKTSSREKFSPTVLNKSNNDCAEPLKLVEKIPLPQQSAINNIDFEPSRLQEMFHPPKVANVSEYKTNQPALSYAKPIAHPERNRAIMIPGRDDNIVSSVNDLSGNLNSTLTFGDTQGLLEKVEDDYVYKPSVVLPRYQFEPLSCNFNENNDSQISIRQGPSSNDSAIHSDTTETDIMLHNFIRHEPPSSLISSATQTQQTEVPPEMFSVDDTKQHFRHEGTHDEQNHSVSNGSVAENLQSAIINKNGQDSGSSVTDSPLQSPYGSFEKQISSPVGNLHMQSQSAQGPFLYHMNLQSNQENMQFANRNLPPQMTYSSIPPGYITSNQPLRGIVPLNPQMPGLPHFRHPNSNVMSSIHNQDLHNSSNQLYQSHLQHLIAMNTLHQYQQAAFNVPESIETLQKAQTNTHSQPHVVQPQMIPTQNQQEIQNQPQILHMQNHPQPIPLQNQPQMISLLETSFPKQNIFINEHHQQMISQNVEEQRNPHSSGSKEEIILQYQQTLEKLSQLQLLLTGSQVQSPVQAPQHQPFVYPAQTIMEVNGFYAGMPVMAQVQPQLNQQVPNTGQMSPNIQQGYLNISGQPNMAPELNVVQASMEVNVGRGRGRLN